MALPRNKKYLPLLLAGPVVIIAVAAYFFVTGGRYVSTDDAYIKSAKTSISAEVAGRVIEVGVTDNLHVAKGQLLFRIDPAPYEIAVRADESRLANTRTEFESLRASYQQTEASIRQAEEALRYQQHETTLNKAMMAKGVVPGERYVESQHNLAMAQTMLQSAQQEMAAEKAKLGGDVDLPLEEYAPYREALAMLDKARLDLQRATVTAPADGVVAHVDMELGEYVPAGVPLFSIVDDKKPWVEANFKETDITNVQPGQGATIHIDTYGGHEWHGTVASITPATGAEFSILPAQNSSGNWVKVVQRVMVRIAFDDYNGGVPLGAGMSTKITIDTGNKSEHKLEDRLANSRQGG